MGSNCPLGYRKTVCNLSHLPVYPSWWFDTWFGRSSEGKSSTPDTLAQEIPWMKTGSWSKGYPKSGPPSLENGDHSSILAGKSHKDREFGRLQSIKLKVGPAPSFHLKWLWHTHHRAQADPVPCNCLEESSFFFWTWGHYGFFSVTQAWKILACLVTSIYIPSLNTDTPVTNGISSEEGGEV